MMFVRIPHNKNKNKNKNIYHPLVIAAQEAGVAKKHPELHDVQQDAQGRSAPPSSVVRLAVLIEHQLQFRVVVVIERQNIVGAKRSWDKRQVEEGTEETREGQ